MANFYVMYYHIQQTIMKSFHVKQQINFKHYTDVKYAPLKRKTNQKLNSS